MIEVTVMLAIVLGYGGSSQVMVIDRGGRAGEKVVVEVVVPVMGLFVEP